MNLLKTPNHIRGPLLVFPFSHETYAIKEENDFYLRLPEMQNNILLRGSCFGWLIRTSIDGVVQMFNPFTNVSYDLPPFSTIPTIVDYHPELKDQEYTIMQYGLFDCSTYTTLQSKSSIQKTWLTKIVISSSPSEDFMALAIYGSTQVSKPDDPYIDVNIKYLVRNVEGDLLMVSRFLNHHEVPGIDDDPEVCYNTEKFKID
ncbi:hypothetical protein Lal_00048886 [Lupinus albus]|nr:hypothetical protein Lal_00048886 [Lupinus albus]